MIISKVLNDKINLEEVVDDLWENVILSHFSSGNVESIDNKFQYSFEISKPEFYSMMIQHYESQFIRKEEEFNAIYDDEDNDEDYALEQDDLDNLNDSLY